jgi:hypothetical protein
MDLYVSTPYLSKYDPIRGQPLKAGRLMLSTT